MTPSLLPVSPDRLNARTHARTFGSTHRNMRKPTPFVVRNGGDLHARGESCGYMYLSGWRGST